MCAQNINTDLWNCELHSANIYDYEPVGFNEEVNTSATTVENAKYNDYLDYIPRIESQGLYNGTEGEIPWGIHLCFFYGLRNNKLNQPIPYGSHHIYDSKGVQVGNWSLAFKAEKINGDQVGVDDMEWKPFFELLNSREQLECTLNHLPFHEYLKLKFSDVIYISNTKMFISKVNTTIPYNKEIKVEAIRIL